MDFLKISLWLFTAILSVHSHRSHMGHNCPYYPFVYSKLIYDQSNCFCFNNPKHHKKVPEVIHPQGFFSERLVYYVYKDIHNGDVKLYIPNREKQYFIPDLAFEEGDIVIDNPRDVLHSYNDLKVLIKTNQNKHIIDEPSIIGDAIITVTTDEPTIKTETPSTITDEVPVSNEKPTATTEEPTVTTKKSTFPTEDLTTSTEKHTITTEEPTTATNKLTIIFEEKADTNEIRTTTIDEPTGTTEGPTTFTDELTITNKKPTIISENSTSATNEPTFIIEEKTVTNEIKTTTTDKPTGTTKGITTFTDDPTVTNKKPTVSTEKPTSTTNEPTFITEQRTVTNEVRTTTTDEAIGTTEGPTTFTNEPSITNKQPTVTTEKPTRTTNEPTFIIEEKTVTNVIKTTITEELTGTTEGPTTITDELSITNKKPTGTTVSTIITEEPTTAHTPEITIITEKTTVTTKIPSTKDPITTESPQPAITTEVPSVTLDETTITTSEPTTEEPSTTKSPEHTITTAEPTTSEEPSPVTILPLLNDESRSGKKFSLHDLYQIIQFIQKNKDEPNVNLWEKILIGLKLDKSQVHKHSEFDKDGGKVEFEITDHSDLEHNFYTFDLWFQHQLDGFSENDKFISLLEIKQYVRNILMENGMIVTMEGLLTDLQGRLLDLRELKLRPILIGKPLNIGKMFVQKDYKSDFLIPSDSPYMQAIVVTLSNPSMILGIIPLGKTKIQKTINKSATVPPPGTHMIKEWLQNGNKYGNSRKQNVWFNIKGRPKLAVGLKDPQVHSIPSQMKIKKYKYFEEPKNNKPKEKYKVKSPRLVGILKENDLRELDTLKNQLFQNQKKLVTERDLYNGWQNDGIVQTDEEPAFSFNIDDRNELDAWENLLKDTTPSKKDLLTGDSDLISSLNGDDSMKLDILNNQLILDSKLTPANGLVTGWQHIGHLPKLLQAGNVKLDPIELDALNHKLLKRPISNEANEMHSAWKNREKDGVSRQVISFAADDPRELNALKNQLLKNPNSFGKAGIKLLAALQRNEIVNAGTGEAVSHKVDEIKKLDLIRDQLLKNPTIFAKTAKKLLSALQRKGIVQSGYAEAVKFKIHNPRELEALRNQLLKHPKIFARAAKELLTVMEHNGIDLSDIAPVSNETVATSQEASELLAEKSSTGEFLSPEQDPRPFEDDISYYDEVEDDITGRIVGGSAATGSGAPLSMKGRMKDF